jgi:hypothetical protein
MGGPPVETPSQPGGQLKIIPEAFQAKMIAPIFVRLEENEVGGASDCQFPKDPAFRGLHFGQPAKSQVGIFEWVAPQMLYVAGSLQGPDRRRRKNRKPKFLESCSELSNGFEPNSLDSKVLRGLYIHLPVVDKQSLSR